MAKVEVVKELDQNSTEMKVRWLREVVQEMSVWYYYYYYFLIILEEKYQFQTIPVGLDLHT